MAIGSVGEQTGVLGAIFSAGPKAVQAWVNGVNAKGGLGCHPLKYIIADDGGDPSRNQALVQRLVEQDGVIAFVHMNAPFAGQASVKYLNDKRVPVIGSETGSPWFYTSPMHFPQASSDFMLYRLVVATAGYLGQQNGGLTKLALIACVEAPACSGANGVVDKYAQEFGLQVVYKASGTLTAPDYTANCQQAKSAGAQIWWIALDGNSVRRLAKSCANVGYHPVFVVAQPNSTLDMTQDAALDGLGVGLPVIPWNLANHPAVAEYQAVLKQYAPGLKFDGQTTLGWVSAKLFEKAASSQPSTITSQSVLDGLWGLKGEDLGGMTYPLRFLKDEPAPQVMCYWMTQIQKGQFVPLNNAQRECK
ncbi:MAG TPA: ABC transporter substrate-binding protein [Acidimicrobiia bacterium]|nr:ABC transporter substrate-binding protein [Acidimicrobiia bacterium]